MPVLVGRKNSIHANRIKQKALLGGVTEGKIRRITVTMKRGKRIRRVTLAEKSFYPRETLPAYALKTQPNLRNPQRQYDTMRKIQELNHKLHLGLPILPTIRLRTLASGEKRLVLTQLKNVLGSEHHFDGLKLYVVNKIRQKQTLPDGKIWIQRGTSQRRLQVSDKEMDDIYREKERVRLLLESNGFKIDDNDAWMFTRDLKTKKIKVWVGDFGNILEVAPENRRRFMNWEIALLDLYQKENAKRQV